MQHLERFSRLSLAKWTNAPRRFVYTNIHVCYVCMYVCTCTCMWALHAIQCSAHKHVILFGFIFFYLFQMLYTFPSQISCWRQKHFYTTNLKMSKYWYCLKLVCLKAPHSKHWGQKWVYIVTVFPQNVLPSLLNGFWSNYLWNHTNSSGHDPEALSSSRARDEVK